jgi:cytoskeletal protein RodZ
MEQAQRRISPDAAVAGAREGEGAEAIGAYLQRQRVLRGISLEELADTTRIPVRSLRRLEAGAFDREPDGFARGFVRTVASALGLPPDETVARMLPEVTDDAQRRGRRRVLARRAVAMLAVLAALGLAMLAWSGARLLPLGWTRDRDELLQRRDAVRALAREHALLGATDSNANLVAPLGVTAEVEPASEPKASRERK